MTTATAVASARRSVTRIAARAFTHPTTTTTTATTQGGNPVTIFLTPSTAPPLSDSIQRDLAQSCAWESVFVTQDYNHPPQQHGTSRKDKDENEKHSSVRFYMPSGEEISFCAHAALAASAASVSTISHTNSSTQQQNVTLWTHNNDDNSQDSSHQTTVNSSNLYTELLLHSPLLESDIPNFVALGHIRDALGLRMEDVSLGGELGLPSYINTAIVKGRNKTLFPMISLETLHRAKNPVCPEEFRDWCDAIGSTGIYLYCPCSVKEEEEEEDEEEEVDGTKDVLDAIQGKTNMQNDVATSTKSPPKRIKFECRQFPRYSGYPEDPATGIAAAALACSLQKRGVISGLDDCKYEFRQGTAMGRPSSIGIRFAIDEKDGEKVVDSSRVYCGGKVELLEKEEVRIGG